MGKLDKPTGCCEVPKTSDEGRPCCAGKSSSSGGEIPGWQTGQIGTSAGDVPVVGTRLTLRDRLGHARVRWGIRRNRFSVSPRLYGVGRPDRDSPVFVTANYKMSFDRLRAQLTGRKAWILVLDTKGINVWCAAGKGTFGTEELIRRIDCVGLNRIVDHRRLVLPQLGATGVSAHHVRKRSAWHVVYGPVRVADLPAFIDAGMKATPEMRRVRWTLADRLSLIPVELIVGFKYLLVIAACLFVLAGLGTDGYSIPRAFEGGVRSFFLLIGAFLAGAAVAPALLPWLPGRAFSLKGAWVGLATALVAVGAIGIGPGMFENRLDVAGSILLATALSSFLTMNFTGASTYTSLSGVRREMRVAVPLQITAASAGIVVWLVGRFI